MAPVWDDVRVKPHVRAAAKVVASTFGITDIQGFATSGHIPGSDHYTGLALDVMTTLKGREVSNWAVNNVGPLCIKYVIWNRGIWDVRDGKGWQPYHGANPHTDHVHLSFMATCNNAGATPVDPSGSVGSASGLNNGGCSQLLGQIFGL
jgi:hypothetical protein